MLGWLYKPCHMCSWDVFFPKWCLMFVRFFLDMIYESMHWTYVSLQGVFVSLFPHVVTWRRRSIRMSAQRVSTVETQDTGSCKGRLGRNNSNNKPKKQTHWRALRRNNWFRSIYNPIISCFLHRGWYCPQTDSLNNPRESQKNSFRPCCWFLETDLSLPSSWVWISCTPDG